MLFKVSYPLIICFQFHSTNMQLPPDANDDKYVNCNVCDKILLRQRYRDHKKEHFEEKLQCSMCDNKFIQSGSLKRHEVPIHRIINGKLGNYAKKYTKEIISIPYNICNKILKGKTCLKIICLYILKKSLSSVIHEISHSVGVLYRKKLLIHRRDKLERLDCEVCGITYFGKISFEINITRLPVDRDKPVGK